MYAPLSLPMSRIYILSILFYSANAILTVIFPLQASRFGMSETNIGILIGLYMLLCMIARPFAGHFIAKYSIYTTLKSLLIVHAITLFIYILFDVKSLYLVRIMQGVVTAFFSMALQLTIQEIVREDERGQGMSLYALSTVLPTIYGPALALSLFSSAPAYVTVFLTALALFPLLLFPFSPFPKKRRRKGRFQSREFLHAFREAIRHPGIRVATLNMLVGAAVFGALTAFLPIFLLENRVANASIFLTLQAVIVVMSRFALRTFIPSDGVWQRTWMSFILLSSPVGTALLAIGPSIGALVYLSALFNGIALALLYPSIVTYLSFVVPNRSKEAVFGGLISTYELGFFCGSACFGIIAELVSFPFMFFTCTLLIVCIFVYTWKKDVATFTLPRISVTIEEKEE